MDKTVSVAACKYLVVELMEEEYFLWEALVEVLISKQEIRQQ